TIHKQIDMHRRGGMASARYARFRSLLHFRLFALHRRRTEAAERLTIPDVLFSLTRYNDRECLEKFRFTKADILRLVDGFALPDRIVTPERTTCSNVEAVCIVLRRFAVPDRWSDLIDMFGWTTLLIHPHRNVLEELDFLGHFFRSSTGESLGLVVCLEFLEQHMNVLAGRTWGDSWLLLCDGGSHQRPTS
ncbi:hypothetical protein DYB35_013466, partial [Aphanomyces astaci]